MINYLYVAIGGGAGAVLRYWLYIGMARFYPSFPAGTLMANLVGCFIGGWLYNSLLVTNPQLKLALLVGGLGALTTFSTYSIEVISMAQKGRVAVALVYWVCSALFSALFCWLGVALGSRGV